MNKELRTLVEQLQQAATAVEEQGLVEEILSLLDELPYSFREKAPVQSLLRGTKFSDNIPINKQALLSALSQLL